MQGDSLGTTFQIICEVRCSPRVRISGPSGDTLRRGWSAYWHGLKEHFGRPLGAFLGHSAAM